MVSSVSRFLLILVLVIPSVAVKAVEPPALSLRAAIKAAQNAQLNFNDREAIAVLGKALENALATRPGLDEITHLVDAHLLLALSFKNTGKRREMDRTLQAAAVLNPFAPANELLVPPSIIGRFATRQKNQRGTSAAGSLHLSSKPDGARVYMNGYYRGKTPLRLDRYPAGEHFLHLRKGKREVVKKITIEAGREKKLQLRIR